MSDNRSYLIDRINGTKGSVYYHIIADVDAAGKIHIDSGREMFGVGDGLAAQVFFDGGAIGIFSTTGKIIVSSRKEDADLEIDRPAMVAEFNRWKQQPEVKCNETHQFGKIQKDYYLCENSYLPD